MLKNQPRLIFLLLAFSLISACYPHINDVQDKAPVAESSIPTNTPRAISPTSPALSASTSLSPVLTHTPNLATVRRWFYYIGGDLDDTLVSNVENSSYDLIVIDATIINRTQENFPLHTMIQHWKKAPHAKIVVAYIDIGQAEEWRTYWEDDWRIGNPDWIVADDPDGWEGNYPVAYWRPEWQNIWLAEDGYISNLIDAGFDGVYLDWIEAYSDENVLSAAEMDGVDPRAEMIAFIHRIADFGRARDPEFLIIAQNAAELAENDAYLSIINAIAQEQTWFDGGADNIPAGDCPLPHSEADVDSQDYANSLSVDCRRQYEEFPDSTLHVSSESYLFYLDMAHRKGKVILTVDYATKPQNVAWIYQTASALGYVPFVSVRNLDIYVTPVP